MLRGRGGVGAPNTARCLEKKARKRKEARGRGCMCPSEKWACALAVGRAAAVKPPGVAQSTSVRLQRRACVNKRDIEAAG